MTAIAPNLAPTSTVAFSLAPLERLAQLHAGCTWRELEEMPGGASSRKYFRIVFPSGEVAVAMFVPDGPKPEEVDNGGTGARWPFLEVRELLHNAGISVPKLLGEDTAAGWLLLEDLGERTLAQVLAAEPAQKQALYRQAVADLARAQLRLENLPPASIVTRRAFDYTLLHWEMDHFREWGLDARGIAFPAESAAVFARLIDVIAKRIANYPRRFVHRDYQSRNLMVRAHNPAAADVPLVWIDFQDALMGPRVYDLVALLNDSYQEFDRAFVEARLAEFAKLQNLSNSELAELIVEFDVCTVQRKLKDAGRFVFIDRVKGNPSFLKFVGPTIQKVRVSLERLQTDQVMRELHELLSATLGAEYSA